MNDATPVPVRPAATVMLLRDGAEGLEVFMLLRHPSSSFVADAYVFPGGAVDAIDRDDPELADVCAGLDDAAASQRLKVDAGGLAYWVAAVRECFEEAGVLLANDRNGAEMSFADDDVHDRFMAARQRVYDGDLRLADLCASEGLRLDLDDLRYVSHWVTPVGPPRRFDTRFFVARFPAEQRPLHDGGETVDSTWINPAEALRRREAGEFEMILPTVANLEALAAHDTVDDVIAWADGLGDLPEILPVITVGPDGPVPLMPGDEGYDEARANLPADGSIPG